MNDFPKLPDNNQCCGCTSCEVICPRNAIKIVADQKGFLNSIIDKTKCIKCKRCEKACPILKKKEKDNIRKVYAAYTTSKAIIMNSSSGGLSREIINAFFSHNIGCKVYGCVIDNNNRIVHYGTQKISETSKFYGSKYVSSDIRGIYSEIVNDLNNDIPVLFFGLPCQVAGLRSVVELLNISEKLYTVDIICHGAGSPALWQKYKSFIEKKYKGKITNFKFRDKTGGWKKYSISLMINGKKIQDTPALKVWLYLFFTGNIQRETCLPCHFANGYRYSDLTIGDFWGIEEHDNEMNNEKGVSIVTINSSKGERLFENVEIKKKELPVDVAYKTQSNLAGGHKMNDNYRLFWKEYSNYGFMFVAKKYGRYNNKWRIINTIRRIVKK